MVYVLCFVFSFYFVAYSVQYRVVANDTHFVHNHGENYITVARN